MITSTSEPEFFVVYGQKTILNIFNYLMKQTNIERSLVSKITSNDLNKSDIFNVGRFLTDFTDINFINDGAYGKVYSVKSRVDLFQYAVKEISLKAADINKLEKVCREFRLLAKLRHGNVVRYYTAWIEGSMEEETKANEISETSEDTGTASAEVQSLSLNNQQPRSQFARINASRSTSSSSSVVPETEVENTNKSLCVVTSRRIWRPRTVYIQMELCGDNLKDWLLKHDCNRDTRVALARQLLAGVRHIHGTGIIHRDLKPANIFLTKHKTDNWQLKIGDFGLARTSENQDGGVLQLSANVGTAFYQAPELKTRDYDHKVDLYSMGIILLEILVSFQTRCDLVQAISLLRDLPNKPYLECLWPCETGVIRNLTSVDPHKRPEADEILRNADLFVKTETNAMKQNRCLLEEMVQIKKENADLRAQLNNQNT